MKAILIPIDDRPITCLYPQMVARLAGVEALCPPRQLLGNLSRPAEINELIAWIDAHLTQNELRGILICLDSILYGGLIPSRRCPDRLEEILQRSASLARWRNISGKSRPVYAQSSIMRISDNYDSSEEKPYWTRYGREIFEWSGCLHRLADGEELANGLLSSLEQKIPPEIRLDYLKGRWRNFQVNRRLLDSVRANEIDFLAFSLDDSGAYGLNVLEKNRLSNLARKQGLGQKVLAYAGADEVILALLSRWLVSQKKTAPKAQVLFSPKATASCPSRYEGQTIEKTVSSQLVACGIEAAGGKDPDFVVIVHGHPPGQGDHIHLPGQANQQNLDTGRAVVETLDLLESIDQPVVLCDVAYANGADPALIDRLLARPDLLKKLRAYAGWNTTGNTVGSALSAGVASWFARQYSPSGGHDRYLKACLFVRLIDDWAYQAAVRKGLDAPVNAQTLEAKLAPYAAKIAQALDFHPDKLEFTLPWQRTFEIEVII